MYFSVYVCSGAPPKKKRHDEAAKGGQGSECVMESMGNACNGQDIVQGLWQPEPV